MALLTGNQLGCAEAVRYHSNWVYEQFFLRSLRRRLRIKHKLYPDLYDTDYLHLVRTIKDFDERYVAHDGGFRNADDYYKRASASPLMAKIRRPSLIIHAQDDPFIPFGPFQHQGITNNPHVFLLAPEDGGHVGFVAEDVKDEDRFWSENRVVQFLSTRTSKLSLLKASYSNIGTQPGSSHHQKPNSCILVLFPM